MKKKVRKKCANCGYIFDAMVEDSIPIKGTKKELKCPKCGSNAIDDYKKPYFPDEPWRPIPPFDPKPDIEPYKPWIPSEPWRIPITPDPWPRRRYKYWCVIT